MENLLEGLNPQQLKAVTHPGGALLIVAGAGTGKTTVITRKIAYLIEHKLAKPEEILALTFTEKAASEMEDRVDRLLPLGVTNVFIATFHGFCEEILARHGLDIGLPNHFELVNDTKQWILVYKNFHRFKLDYYRPMANPEKFIDALLNHFSKCKDELIFPEDYLQYAEDLELSGGSAEMLLDGELSVEISRIREIANAYHTYQRVLLENNLLDFGDLINFTLQLFKKRPNILKKVSKQYKYILVDEFQDTNFAQYQLVKMMVESGEGNLTVVGDDDQSIYKFRGASISNILKIKDDFKELSQITLTDNYRSSQPILDLAYNFIQNNNPDRLEEKLKIDKRLVSHYEGSTEILVLEGEDLHEELDLVIKKILKLREANSNLSWNDFAILVRSNSAAIEIVSKLETIRIPYYFMANRGLYHKPLIADLISYLRLVGNFHESHALYRILNFSKFELEVEEIAKLTQFTYKRAMSLYEALQNQELLTSLTEISREKIRDLSILIQKHANESKSLTIVELLVMVVGDLGLIDELSQEDLENAQNREYLEQFYKSLETFSQENTDRSLNSYLGYLDLELRAGYEGDISFDMSLGPESLKVMTIHSSKGLEFEYVFVINMVDQRFPTRKRGEAIEIPKKLVKDILPEGDFHLQEERRLFYVAATRAKKGLYFSWSKNYGGNRLKKPSIFLKEAALIPSEAISKPTGKVVLTRPNITGLREVYHIVPQYFSYSDINTFTNCPLEYKYRVYLRLPLPGAAPLSFGSTIHKVLQSFLTEFKNISENLQQDLFGEVKKPELPAKERLFELYDASWIDEWYSTKEQKEQYRKKGLLLLNNFYEYTEKHIPAVEFLEQPFKIPIGKYFFTGKIDRADLGNGGLEVIDYKTGSVPKNKTAMDLDQLRVYQWAITEYFNKNVESLNYWYLESQEFKEVELAKPEEIDKLKLWIEEKITEIVESVKFDNFLELHKKTAQHNCRFQ